MAFIVVGGSSGANKSLSNLSSPVAVNQQLLVTPQGAPTAPAYSFIGHTNSGFDLDINLLPSITAVGVTTTYWTSTYRMVSELDSNNYLDYSTSTFEIHGSSVVRLHADGTNVFDVTSSGANLLTGNLTANVNNASDIGSSSFNWRNIYVGTAVINASPQTTLTGSAGTAICSQPEQGSSYKKVVIYLNGYTDTGTQVYTYPVAFTRTPYVYGLAAGVSGATASTTSARFTTTLLSGFVFIEGY